MADFTAAVERIVAGLEKRNRLLNMREREIVAHHEMGHALVAMALPGSEVVHKVSIIPRGVGALGYTIQRPTEDRFLMTRDELENKMAVLLGGRAAEWIVYGHLSTGAADDLARVTDIARAMVTRYGMSERLGHPALEREARSFLAPAGPPERTGERAYSEDTAAAVDSEVRTIVKAAFDKAVAILEAQHEVLMRTAAWLLEKETLDAAELQRLVRNEPLPASPNQGSSCAMTRSKLTAA
jgi:cell division protease FtsH